MTHKHLALTLTALLSYGELCAADHATFTGTCIYPESITSLDDGTPPHSTLSQLDLDTGAHRLGRPRSVR